MAPEQIHALGATPARDRHRLGRNPYQLPTGPPPFEGTMTAVLAQVITAVPPPPTALRPDVDELLESICLQAMAKQPEQRYATMSDFVAALDGYLHPLTVVSEPTVQEPPVEGPRPTP